MGNKTLTRADLADAVVRRASIMRHEAQDIVEMVLGEIADSLEKGETVKLSSFGSFGVREKSERMGRNPRTGEDKVITPRRVLFFKASNVMKNKINRYHGKQRNGAKP
ncbi:MAG: integration host factor subunit alpha [Pseudomonadota bacterium]